MGGKTGLDSALGSFVKEVSGKFESFGGQTIFFTSPNRGNGKSAADALLAGVDRDSGEICRAILSEHSKQPFHLIHCHDWYSFPAGAAAAASTGVPVVLSLHSTEHERLQGNRMDDLSASIFEREKEAVKAADLVVAPHSSTRQQLVNLYDADPEKVVIVAETIAGGGSVGLTSPQEVKRRFGIPPDAPVVLFSGEVSHAAGADLLIDALPAVCNNHRTVHFILAGDGPLKGELQGRAGHAGIAHRCRFLGHITRETFEDILTASDFVVIPARTWQGEGLAQAAIAAARPVLTTRQAGVNCVVHGQNGLVTFDNPGSIVWGIQELLFNPMQGTMIRMLARKNAGESSSPETVAAQLYICYEMVLRKRGES
jgi:glycosyltransferase involved in cell wall biosynthesis